jgi:sugar phosphate isomerase/epimerase
VQFAGSTWSFYRRRKDSRWPPLPEVVRRVARLDRSLGIEIWPSSAGDAPPPVGTQRQALIDACDGMPNTSVHIRPEFWSWSPRHLREELQFAHALGADTLVLHPVCLGLSRPEDRPDWPEIRRIAEDADVLGVRLAVENVGNSVALLDRLLDALGDDPERTNVGLCLDVGHAALSDDAGRQGVLNYLDRYAGAMIHLHLHDNAGAEDDHRCPGRGTIDWSAVMERLTSLNYKGPAVLEIHEPDLPPEETLRQSLAFLRARNLR